MSSNRRVSCFQTDLHIAHPKKEFMLRSTLHAVTGTPRWYLVYFVLAGFDIVTISVSLYLNHRLVGIYSETVAQN